MDVLRANVDSQKWVWNWETYLTGLGVCRNGQDWRLWVSEPRETVATARRRPRAEARSGRALEEEHVLERVYGKEKEREARSQRETD